MAPPSRMVTLDSDIFKCCHRTTTLGWSQDGHARYLLQRATNQVRPIMAKRKWTVPVVSEFYPRSANLMGLNHAHGAKIELRLRAPSNPDAFLPYESILGTLLHELAHNKVGPHNAQFYALLDELNAECDALIARGNDGTPGGTGAAFAGRGHRVADGVRGYVPRHIARERAVMAAQERERVGRLMRAGGRRLGGSADIARVCDPREMALAAAQRRMADEIWCGSALDGGQLETVAADIVDVDEEDEVQVVETRVARKTAVRRAPPPRPPRMPARRVPVRQNPAALAALQRQTAGKRR